MAKIIIGFIIIGALATATVVGFSFSGKNGDTQKSALPAYLRSLGYEADVKYATFRGHQSQNISAEKDKANVLVQIVSGVKDDAAPEILEQLRAPVLDAQQDIVMFNPYIAEEVTLRVPEELKPVKKETKIQGASIGYYLTHANAIFSMMVYSEPEVRYKGLFATYFCPSNNTAYKTEIYYPAEEEFDEEKALNLFSSLYCSG